MRRSFKMNSSHKLALNILPSSSIVYFVSILLFQFFQEKAPITSVASHNKEPWILFSQGSCYHVADVSLTNR